MNAFIDNIDHNLIHLLSLSKSMRTNQLSFKYIMKKNCRLLFVFTFELESDFSLVTLVLSIHHESLTFQLIHKINSYSNVKYPEQLTSDVFLTQIGMPS